MASRAKRRNFYHDDDKGGRNVKQTKIQEPVTSSVQQVFNTTELLEQIMQHLPCTQLFLLQRLDSSTRDVIHQAPHLRQKMFLEAGEEHTISSLPEAESIKTSSSPLHNKKLCPALAISPIPGGYVGPLIPATRTVITINTNLNLDENSASWKRMHLTSPPTRKVFIRLKWDIQGPNGAALIQTESVVEDENGLRMGKMFQKALYEKAKVKSYDSVSRMAVLQAPALLAKEMVPIDEIRRLEEKIGGKAELDPRELLSFVSFPTKQ